MNKIWVVARREYLATVRTKAFVIGIVLMPVCMTLGGLIGAVSRRMEDQGERTFVIVDRTPNKQAFQAMQAAVARRNENDITDHKTGQRLAPKFVVELALPEKDLDEQRFVLSERVRKGELAGFLVVGPKALDVLALVKAAAKPKERTSSTTSLYQSRPTIAGAMEFYRFSLVELTLAAGMGTREALTNPRAPVEMMGLSSRDPKTGQVIDDAGATKATARVVVGVGCIMLMFVILFAVATPLMQGVLEEKMQRISEVLLGSLTPFELMAGKLLGGVGVALTLATVYLGGAYGGLWYYGYADMVPAGLLAWFVFYQTLAILMYGSMFMAVGAACTDMKEPQTLMLPVMLPAMLPLFLLGPILSDPDGALARTVAFFPPSTPMLMLGRQALSANVQWWEPVLGSLLVLAFTIFCVWMAGRIFRVGILVQGKGATLSQMMGWVFRGE